MIGLTREYRPNWSFSMILCRDFDRLQWVRIAKVALHYTPHPVGIDGVPMGVGNEHPEAME